MTNPADVKHMIDEIRRVSEEQRARVEQWNEQMLAAVEVIRTAAAHEHGVIVSVSHVKNTIEAVEWPTVEAGTAFVFDRDREDGGRPAPVQLADWIHDDTPLETVASGYDPMRAYAMRFYTPLPRTDNPAAIITSPSEV